ncbi:MAG: hypothetical protein KAR16_10625 [Bacteroidales bacterium]|nr:hypothetical protein [Bacteroidales bacterium]
MGKKLNSLVIFLVMVTLIAFIVIAIYSFIGSCSNGTSVPTDRLTYVANVLVGLVGGIVATAFGVELPTNTGSGKERHTNKMHNLGSFVMTGSFRKEDNYTEDPVKIIFGVIYAWVYILVCLAAIIIWIVDDKVFSIVESMATVSLGLMLVIVKNYFQ